VATGGERSQLQKLVGHRKRQQVANTPVLTKHQVKTRILETARQALQKMKGCTASTLRELMKAGVAGQTADVHREVLKTLLLKTGLLESQVECICVVKLGREIENQSTATGSAGPSTVLGGAALGLWLSTTINLIFLQSVSGQKASTSMET
jgi:hypothetical protein